VRENLEFAMVCIGAHESDINRRIQEVLDLVSLTEKDDRFPDELSGGEQQRVAIARAIINHPLVVVADEPTGNLDPKLSEEIMKVFYRIHEEEKITMVVITHAAELVRNSGKRVIEIDEGGIKNDFVWDENYVEEGE
jgi:cell division transport system ATP-binding protein